jgi:hypothetical protein
MDHVPTLTVEVHALRHDRTGDEDIRKEWSVERLHQAETSIPVRLAIRQFHVGEEADSLSVSRHLLQIIKGIDPSGSCSEGPQRLPQHVTLLTRELVNPCGECPKPDTETQPTTISDVERRRNGLLAVALSEIHVANQKGWGPEETEGDRSERIGIGVPESHLVPDRSRTGVDRPTTWAIATQQRVDTISECIEHGGRVGRRNPELGTGD